MEEAGSTYTQATVDLEVDKSPVIREWLIQHSFIETVSSCMMLSHCLFPISFDDVFIVKYDADLVHGQRGLKWHFDAGNISFMLALSPKESYCGGGTAFDVLQEGEEFGDDIQTFTPLHLNQGELLVFDACLYHTGLDISCGTRYLLVGFCFTHNKVNGEMPGEVGLDLRPLRGLS